MFDDGNPGIIFSFLYVNCNISFLSFIFSSLVLRILLTLPHLFSFLHRYIFSFFLPLLLNSTLVSMLMRLLVIRDL